MKYIQKDEQYNWMGASMYSADAQIPDELHQKLYDSIAMYQNVCMQIDAYLNEHPENLIDVIPEGEE